MTEAWGSASWDQDSQSWSPDDAMSGQRWRGNDDQDWRTSSRGFDGAGRADTENSAVPDQSWWSKKGQDQWSSEDQRWASNAGQASPHQDIEQFRESAEVKLNWLYNQVTALTQQVAQLTIDPGSSSSQTFTPSAIPASIAQLPSEPPHTEAWCFSQGFHSYGMGTRLERIQILNMKLSQWQWWASIESKGIARIPLACAMKRLGSDLRFSKEGKAFYVAQIACANCWTQFQVSITDGEPVIESETKLAKFLLLDNSPEMQLDPSRVTY